MRTGSLEGRKKLENPVLPKLTFVLGGAASGKSAYAEKLVLTAGGHRVYLATAQVFDDEMRAKVDRHVTMRGDGWRTQECPFEVTDALSQIAETETVLLDCATMWLTNVMLSERDLAAETTALLNALETCKGRVVVVSNEVGMGVVPDNALARRFRDEQGRLNQRLADQSDLSVFVIAGQPVVLKGEAP